MKKLVLFDIDGVIYDGHLIFDSIQDQEKIGFIKIAKEKGWKIVNRNTITDIITTHAK